MQTNIEKLRADMANEQRKMRLEDRRFYLQLTVAFAAVFAAGVSLAKYVDHHDTSKPTASTLSRP